MVSTMATAVATDATAPAVTTSTMGKDQVSPSVVVVGVEVGSGSVLSSLHIPFPSPPPLSPSGTESKQTT